MVGRSLALLAALILAACGHAPKHDWKTTVRPTDSVPVECTASPGAKPKVAAREHTGAEAARAYRKLDKFTDKTLRQLDGCQTWSKGQR